MRLQQLRISAFALLVGLVTSVAFADAPAKLNVYPPDVDLTTVRDRQSMIVQAAYSDGITRDVTEQATFALANTEVARLAGNVVLPVADGETVLKVEFEGKTVEIPVVVKQATADPPVSFNETRAPIPRGLALPAS